MSVTVTIAAPILYSLFVAGGAALLASAAAATIAAYAVLPEVLRNSSAELNSLAEQKQPAEQFYSRPTFIEDVCILRQAVESLGGRTSGENQFSFRDFKIVLHTDASAGKQTLWFCGPLAGAKAVKALAGEIEKEYVRQAREAVLQKLHTECRGCGLHLESEEVEQDQSIVLTFRA